MFYFIVRNFFLFISIIFAPRVTSSFEMMMTTLRQSRVFWQNEWNIIYRNKIKHFTTFARFNRMFEASQWIKSSGVITWNDDYTQIVSLLVVLTYNLSDNNLAWFLISFSVYFWFDDRIWPSKVYQVNSPSKSGSLLNLMRENGILFFVITAIASETSRSETWKDEEKKEKLLFISRKAP